MKIITYTSLTSDEHGKIVNRGESGIEFDSMHDGTHRAIVPVTLPGYGNNRRFCVAIPMTLESGSEVNRKGKTRIVLKSTSEYKALRKDSEPLSTGEYYDATRSGGEISCHVVISVAKSVRDDLSGTNGSACQKNASAQVAVCMQNMLACLGGWARSYQGIGSSDFISQQTPATTEVGKDSPLEMDQGLVILDSVAPTVVIEPQAAFGGQSGFSVTSDSNPELGTMLDNPITRGLNGFEPIAEDSSVLVPKVFDFHLAEG